MIITQTPLRISLLGGNTDNPRYFLKHGGAVLTTTIDKYVYCIVKERFDNEIWINYSKKEKVKKVKNIKHDLVREAMKLTGVDKGIEITFLSDIPSEGSGLGSSSAVVVGLLNALYAYKGMSPTREKIAEEACEIEILKLKKPIGIQDQYAVAYGGFNLLYFNRNGVDTTPIDPEGIADSLMLFYTGLTRKSETILSKTRVNKKILDRMKNEAYKKLDHINDPVILGDLLDRYWAMKIKLNKEVTNPQINKMYSKALGAGALGGKIVGAGAGGFMLLVVPSDKQNEVRSALKGYRELPFGLSRYGSRVIFNTHE